MTDHECSGKVYHLRDCIRCCARYVIAANPSRKIQESNIGFLTHYFNRDRQAILDAIASLKREPK